MKDFRKKLKPGNKGLYFIILGLLFALFIALVLFNVEVKKQISRINVSLSPFEFEPGPYPAINRENFVDISAQGAIVMDKNSGVVLYEKNPNFIFPPASTTKIMTALTALEHYRLDDVLVVKSGNIEGSVIGLVPGQRVKFENLLYAMMLPSANDATVAIADNYPGGTIEFVKKMNENAKKYNLISTHFEDPSGLRDDAGYSNAEDLARLTRIALNNPKFSEVVSTKSKTIEDESGKKYSLTSLNTLLGTRGVNGVKTGFTEAAGEVLVTSKKIEGTQYDVIIVVMQSLDRIGDTEKILDYLTGNVNYQSIRP